MESSYRTGGGISNRPQILKFAKIEHAREVSTRPACPKCGALNPISHGISWMCRECGCQWVKIKHPKIFNPNDGRPPCPSCGSKNPTSQGDCWHCSNCGRKWGKVKMSWKNGS